MSRTLLVAGLFVSALGLGCAVPARVDLAAEANAVRARSAEWLAADKARDIERAVSLYADDAVELAANTPLVVGKEAIRAWYGTWLTQPNLSLTFATSSVDVSPSGEVAWERGTYEFTTVSPTGTSVDKGKYLTVWKKVKGTWMVAADMANSDLPTPG